MRYIPAPLSEVEFYTAAAVENNATEYAPPSLAVRVYANPGGLGISEWINAQEELAVRVGSRTPTTIAGREALEVCMTAPMAGGCSLFVAQRSGIVELVPLEPGGALLLQGLLFTP
jgi:hypothetical protein